MHWYRLAALEALVEPPNDFEAVADACIANHEAILQHGSPEMQTASRMLLYALVDEVRRREQATDAANDDEA